MNEILLRRKNKLLISKGTATESSDHYIVSIMKNIEDLGYTFSEQVFDCLQTFTREELGQFYLELIPLLKKQIGANVVYKPMYPNFPQSVMEEEEASLYLKAMIHYWSGGTFYPYQKKKERLPLFEPTAICVLELGTWQELEEVISHLMESKTSISQTDKKDVEWFFQNTSDGFEYLPKEIPLKENAALIGKIIIENATFDPQKILMTYFKTATDVLRLATALSEGDISLAYNTRFRSLKRKERRILMSLLENCHEIEEDMLRYRDRWIRLGERLHPGEYSQYPKTKAAFRKLRNGEKIETFGGKVAEALKKKEIEQALSLLKKRPGELARKLDYLFRISNNKKQVIAAFHNVAREVSTPVLLQVKEHFVHRYEEQRNIRVFFPKGNLAKAFCLPNTLPDLDKEYCDAVVKICENTLIEAYQKRKFLGSVYLNPEFKNYLVPFSQRSASKTLKTLTRGSKIPLDPAANAIRAFIWWTNMDNSNSSESSGRVDIDLSAAIFDQDWNYMEHVSYTNLRSEKYRSCHSGDITNGGSVSGEGVSEFLDVDMNSVLRCGGRYIVYQVYSYTCQTFQSLPHCMFGWMEREDVNSGEIYEPKTVKQKMELTAQSLVCIPVIFDCLECRMIWCDMSLGLYGCHRNCGGNNIESNLSGVVLTCYSMVNLRKPNLYDLIELHIQARGMKANTKEEADIIFDLEEGIPPWDTELFMAEYL